MPLSGPAALYGEPAVKGARMFVDEINAAGGVLGKKIELVVRDSKASADEAVRVSREMILKEEVQFLVGTLTSAEGPAVSTIAKENKIILIAPIPKTDQLTAPKNLHPYVFRTAANTTMEGRSVRRDHRHVEGRQEGCDHRPRLRLWAGRGEVLRRPPQEAAARHRDRRPAVAEARRGRLHALHQRADGQEARGGVLGPVGRPFRHLGKAGQAAWVSSISCRTVSSMAARPAPSRPRARWEPTIPFGICGNSYDLAAYAGQSEAHKKYIERIKAYTKEDPPSTWPITVYVAMQFLVEGIKKASSLDSDKVAKALARSDDRRAVRQADAARVKDHQADRGQFYGKMVKGPAGNAIMTEVKYVDPKPFMD